MKSYKIDPAGSCSFGGAALTSLTSFQYGEEADEVTHNTDGSEFIGGAFTDDKRYRVVVNGTDNDIRPSVGDTGNLVLEAAQRANGDGTVGDGLTFTFSGAVCIDTSGTVNHGGNSETVYTFLVPGKLEQGVYTDPLAVT